MGEVVGIETVVAQFVDNDLVGREVVGAELPAQLVYGQKEGRFAQLVAVSAVGIVPHGTYGEEHFEVVLLQALHQRCPGCDDFVDRGHLEAEMLRRQFVAVGHDEAVVLKLVVVGRPEGDDDLAALAEKVVCLGYHRVAGVDAFVGAFPRKSAVVEPGMPEAVVLYQNAAVDGAIVEAAL